MQAGAEETWKQSLRGVMVVVHQFHPHPFYAPFFQYVAYKMQEAVNMLTHNDDPAYRLEENQFWSVTLKDTLRNIATISATAYSFGLMPHLFEIIYTNILSHIDENWNLMHTWSERNTHLRSLLQHLGAGFSASLAVPESVQEYEAYLGPDSEQQMREIAAILLDA